LFRIWVKGRKSDVAYKRKATKEALIPSLMTGIFVTVVLLISVGAVEWFRRYGYILLSVLFVLVSLIKEAKRIIEIVGGIVLAAIILGIIMWALQFILKLFAECLEFLRSDIFGINIEMKDAGMDELGMHRIYWHGNREILCDGTGKH